MVLTWRLTQMASCALMTSADQDLEERRLKPAARLGSNHTERMRFWMAFMLRSKDEMLLRFCVL